MNNVKDLLPNGSVVLLHGGKKKIMIFGIKQTDQQTGTVYDYIGVIYPEGNIGPGGQFFFNHKDIQEVFFTGYTNDEREDFIQRLSDYFSKQEK